MKTVTLSKMEHKGDTRIRVDFPYDFSIIQNIKQLSGSKWSPSKKCWHMPYSKESYAMLQNHFEIKVDKEIFSNSLTQSSLAFEKETVPEKKRFNR